jgi:hydroxymethylbilane synthase
MTALLRIGTRGSLLALTQATLVKNALATAHPVLAAPGAIAIQVIKTTGDLVQDRNLSEIGGKGLFTREIEEALLAGDIDVAVHSMKDVPTVLPLGLAITTLLERDDPRDALIGPYASLADLPHGATVGTSSLRRGAQVLHARPDVKIVPFRGNVDTRLRKLREGQVDATLLAAAGLNRLNLGGEVAALLDYAVMLPAVAQGAIGLEARIGDTRIAAYLGALDHTETHLCVLAERSLLATLDGNCRTPIGGYARLSHDGGMQQLTLDGLLISPDGHNRFWERRSAPPEQAEALGIALGKALLAAQRA